VGAYPLADVCSAIEEAGNGSNLERVRRLTPEFEAQLAAVQEYLRDSRLIDDPEAA
jgi:hypothetical protein